LGLPAKIFVVVAKAMEFFFFVEMVELFVAIAGELNNFVTKKDSNRVRRFYHKEQLIQGMRI